MTEYSDKEIYREYCRSEVDIPLYCQPNWLDAVCGDAAWDVVVHSENSNLLGAIPYRLKSKFGFNFITTARLTQHMGPVINANQTNIRKKESNTYRVLTELLNKLPYTSSTILSFKPGFDCWLPAYWDGFQQTTRFTYQITETDVDKIWSKFSQNIRTDIRKASNRFNLKTIECTDSNSIFDLTNQTFIRKNRKNPYSSKLLTSVHEYCKRNNCGKIIQAVDDDDQVHAAILVVWDNTTSYYLVGASSSEFKNSGALSYLLWNAITESAQEGRVFDFEGSMLKEVEKFVRAFGAERCSYSILEKQKNYIQLAKLLQKSMGQSRLGRK